MHHNCAVSHCSRQTQDRICEPCGLELRDALLAVARAKHPTIRHLPSGPTEIYHGGLWEDLEISLTKQHALPKAPRVGSDSGAPLAFSVAASDARRELEAMARYWAGEFHIANQHLTFDPYQTAVPETCQWLSTFPGLLMQLECAEDMHMDIVRAVTRGFRAVDTMPLKSFVGVCVVSVEKPDKTIGPCDTGLFVLDDYQTSVCTGCSTVYAAEESRQAVIGEALKQEGTPREVEALFGAFGISVKMNSVRTWARNGELKQAGERGGHATYLLADVYVVAGQKQTRNHTPKVA